MGKRTGQETGKDNSYDLFIVHRPIRTPQPQRIVLKSIAHTPFMSEKQTLHCGIRSIDKDSYFYDYHTTGSGDSKSMMVYIEGPMANTSGLFNKEKSQLRLIGSRPQRDQLVAWQAKTSANEIGDIANNLLKKFNNLGGYHWMKLNCQHFTAALVLSLSNHQIDEMDLREKIWGEVHGTVRATSIKLFLKQINRIRDLDVDYEKSKSGYEELKKDLGLTKNLG